MLRCCERKASIYIQIPSQILGSCSQVDHPIEYCNIGAQLPQRLPYCQSKQQAHVTFLPTFFKKENQLGLGRGRPLG